MVHFRSCINSPEACWPHFNFFIHPYSRWELGLQSGIMYIEDVLSLLGSWRDRNKGGNGLRLLSKLAKASSHFLLSFNKCVYGIVNNFKGISRRTGETLTNNQRKRSQNQNVYKMYRMVLSACFSRTWKYNMGKVRGQSRTSNSSDLFIQHSVFNHGRTNLL